MAKPSNTSKDFDEFVKQQQATDEERQNWRQERDEWLSRLDSLYRQIQSYLKPYIQRGTIAISFSEIILTEEYIGPYGAQKMEIQIGRQKVTLTPVGTLLVGTKGRVDVEGNAGRSRIVLVDKRAESYASLIKVTVIFNSRDSNVKPPESMKREPIEWSWKIVSPLPEGRFIELAQDSLFAMLLHVSNG
jgi:hypothetical protein